MQIIPDLYEVIEDKEKSHPSDYFVNMIIDLSHLLVCINSTANFLIYMLGGTKFR